MRKIALFFILALVASTVNAKTMETILWNDTYTDGVELNSEAVRDAQENIKMNGLDNIEILQGDATEFMTEMAANGTRADVDAWYTLHGVRMAQPVQKGIYIHNGRKVLMK